MFRITAALVLLLASGALSAGADDVAPALKAGVWYADVKAFVMGTRYEYTFRKDGTFRVEILNDAPNAPVTGTWKLAGKGGKSVLTLATKGDRAHLLPGESEVRYDKAKNVLVVRGKDGAEVVLKFRKGR